MWFPVISGLVFLDAVYVSYANFSIGEWREKEGKGRTRYFVAMFFAESVSNSSLRTNN